MISTREADRLIDETCAGWSGAGGSVEVAIEQAIGRVIARGIAADRDQPPFDRVAMDGIAVVVGDGIAGDLRLDGCLAAGQSRPEGEGSGRPGTAIEVMTGAALPPPFDAVVPWEELKAAGDGVSYHVQSQVRVRAGMNIHRRASDYRQGQELIAAGTRLLAPHIHILAGVGCRRVEVLPLPRITLLATGDELVGVEEVPAPHQIRMSNMPTIASCLTRAGFPVLVSQSSRNRRDELERALADALSASDLVLVSGAVSKGSKDSMPAVLAGLGCRLVFHGGAQKPGKPLWFGTSPGGAVVFALPGNPVSSLVCFLRYVLPLLRRWGETGPAARPGALVLPSLEAVVAAPLAHLLPAEVVARGDGGSGLHVRASGGSGNYAGLLPSDGIVEVPAGTGAWPDATPLPFFPWP